MIVFKIRTFVQFDDTVEAKISNANFLNIIFIEYIENLDNLILKIETKNKKSNFLRKSLIIRKN